MVAITDDPVGGTSCWHPCLPTIRLRGCREDDEIRMCRALGGCAVVTLAASDKCDHDDARAQP